MKALTKAKNLRSILAEKLETGWTITPIEIEQAGGYSVKCWHKFSCRKEVKACGKIVYSHELHDIVDACDLYGAAYFAHIPYGTDGTIEFHISLTEFYTDKEMAEREAKEQEGAE